MKTIDVLRGAIQRAGAVGWAVLDSGLGPEEIASAVSTIGVPRRSRDRAPGIERLVPQRAADAMPRSLSAKHGLGAFPFHSDAAHWFTPARWSIMWCERNDSDRATRLLPWSAIAPKACSDSAAVFLISNGPRSFFVDVRESARLDPGCMIPQNAAARALIELAHTIGDESPDVVAVNWRPGTIAVLDNTAMLHARCGGQCDAVPDCRILWRALLDSN